MNWKNYQSSATTPTSIKVETWDGKGSVEIEINDLHLVLTQEEVNMFIENLILARRDTFNAD